MNVSVKLSPVLLSALLLAFLTYGCAHKNTPLHKGVKTNTHPVVTMANSDFYALNISGKNEIPLSFNLGASGKLFLKTNKKETQIYFTLYVDSLKNITKATINYGTDAYNGPPIVTLYPDRHSYTDSLIGKTFSGELNSGTITRLYLIDGAMEGGKLSDLIRAIKNDSAYVQIATKYHPRIGAIRGQIKIKKESNK